MRWQHLLAQIQVQSVQRTRVHTALNTNVKLDPTRHFQFSSGLFDLLRNASFLSMRTSLILLLLIACARAQTPTAPSPAKSSPFNVDVVVSTSQRRVTPTSYRKTMEITTKVTITGKNRAAPLPAAEAILMLITMDTRAKYAGRAEEYKVNEVETLPIAAAPSGAPQTLPFTGSEVTFDSYRDSSNVGGEVYKYYVLAIRDPEAGDAVMNFETNHTQLAAFIKAHPEKCEEILKIRKGAKFPTQFK